MTANKHLKRRVRARASKTGESYTAALRHYRRTSPGASAAGSERLRIAVAQSVVCEDPRQERQLQECGDRIRRLMREAHAAGARLVHFPEGATCSPHKRTMSIHGPDRVGPADWSRAQWRVLRQDLNATAALARELELWTVLGSVHPLTPPHRPHNSLYVISDQGDLTTRYDERLLSNTKLQFMYTPGAAAITFEIDGVRFGCALGIEVHFPEVFIEYEQLGVDCVLFSSAGPGARSHAGIFATEAQSHAATNSFWVSYAVTAQDAVNAPSGVISPEGDWIARCPTDGSPAVAVVDLDKHLGNPARPWRQKVREGIYDMHLIRNDPRSDQRSGF